MPPRQKEAVKIEPVEGGVKVQSIYEPAVGDFVHVLTRGGAKFKSSELLYIGSRGITVRTDIYGPTQAEVSFIPWTAIDGVGLCGKR